MTDPAADRALPDWEPLYRETPAEGMPWFYGPLDPDVAAALDRLQLRPGRAVDLGTGPGTQAIELARRGFRVVGTDLSPSAVEKATARAAAVSVAPGSVRFVVDDVLDSRLPASGFELALDRGVFHLFAPVDRPRYVKRVKRLVGPGGTLLLKCFSDEQPGVQGPFQYSPEELTRTFSPYFDVRSIERTVYHGTREPRPKALFCVLEGTDALA